MRIVKKWRALHENLPSKEKLAHVCNHSDNAFFCTFSIFAIECSKILLHPWDAVHAVHMRSKLLYVGNYLNPSFGPFSPVCCSATGFFYASCALRCGTFELPPIFTHFQPFWPIFTRFCCTFFVLDGWWIMMTGNHRTSCTFSMQQTGRWAFTHSKANSNLHGHCLAISRKQCCLWILLMSHHLNPLAALSDHRKLVAWLISNVPHRAAYCYKLGPNRVKTEGRHHLPTHSRNCRSRMATATNHQGYDDPGDARINAGCFHPFLPGYVSLCGHCMRTQCARIATTWPKFR